MTAQESGNIRVFVVLLLSVQVIAVVLAWTLNPIGQRSETLFALLLAADLVAFSVISYVNRTYHVGRGTRGSMLMAGSVAVLFLMVMVLLA